MKDIARALSVSAPSLYNHVQDKQTLLFDIMDAAMDRALDELAQALEGADGPAEQLERAISASVLDFLRHPADITVCNTEIRSLEGPNRPAIIEKRDTYSRRIQSIVDQGCREGAFDTDEPHIASFAVLELGNNAVAWYRASGPLSAESVARMYGEFALRIVGCMRASTA
jgi:AcrR family transcriptional regulator